MANGYIYNKHNIQTYICSLPHMESTHRRIAHHVVGIFLTSSIHVVGNSTGLSDEAKGVPVHVYHVHNLDRHQFVHSVLDVVDMR